MTREQMKRSAKEGLAFGIAAGVIFAVAEIIAAGMMGNPPLMPVRMFSSVVLGQSGMQSPNLGMVIVVGVLAHLVLSAGFGLVYGLINGALSGETRGNLARQSAIGLAFGALVFVFNFQIVARILYPWFLNAPQLLQLMMHALFFGLPLGLMYGARERRVRRVEVEAPA